MYIRVGIAFTIFQLFFISIGFSQVYTQTIRGSIIDKLVQTPLPGAVVIVLNSDPLINTTTDSSGNFKLLNVSVGKQSLKISLLGYKEVVLSNVIVNSGKETVLLIALEENIVQSQEVVVTADKSSSLTSMNTVSSRTFSVEETQKYAAAFNDPARMALSFPGVIQADDIKNDISVRGNSPNGLLWRMEGVDIPNPNHFTNVGTAGGAISILSSQLLSNSEFMTGAFSPEYGNVLSGVFDLKLRKGNNEKYEFTAQAGLLGIDLSSEGPLKKGYKGSYLINYRYSALALLAKLGLPLSSSTLFQDLSFNIYLPTARAGSFTLFGFGGLSSDNISAVKDSLKWENSFDRSNKILTSNTAVTGVTHSLNFRSRAFLKTVLAVSGINIGNREEVINTKYIPFLKSDESYQQNKLTLTSTLNYKFSSWLSLRTGVIANYLDYSLSKSAINFSSNQLENVINTNGNTYLFQEYAQLNYRITEKLTANAGVHYMQLILNNSNALDPRASLKYRFTPTQSIALAYGLHSQMQPIGVYFSKVNISSGVKEQMNKNLGLSRAHHLVLAYELGVNDHARIRVETYYQHLFGIPVSPDFASTFSLLNVQNGYVTQQLVNDGIGRNYGIELTLERFLYKNFYFLISSSLFNSEYAAKDGVWRNTYYNTNYSLTVTSGKDFILSERFKKRTIGVHFKTIYTGGYRRSPIDMGASIQQQEIAFVNDKAFSLQNPDYFRVDMRISCKRNFAKLTTTLALDIQNVTSYKNVRLYYFDPVSTSIKAEYQLPLVPVLSYRFEF